MTVMEDISYYIVITFFDRLMMKTASAMPDNSDNRPPLFDKNEVYSLYSHYFPKIYPRESPILISDFLAVLKKNSSTINR